MKLKLPKMFDQDPVYADFDTAEKLQSDPILYEKRKRFQIYSTLNQINSLTTCFDFFSRDAIKVCLNAKILADALEQDTVTSDLFLISFLKVRFTISSILLEHDFTKKRIVDVYYSLFDEYSQDTESIQEKILKRIPTFIERFFINPSKFKANVYVPFSFEMEQLLEMAADNAMLRFKTPIITPEILFITFMENKKTRIGRVIKKLAKTELEWYLLRFKLIKRIHFHEVNIRNKIKQSEQFYAYLFKTQITEFEFDRMFERGIGDITIYMFRNRLIKRALPINNAYYLKKEIHRSIKLTTNRKYST